SLGLKIRADADSALAALRGKRPHVRGGRSEKELITAPAANAVAREHHSNSISGGSMSRRLLRADGTNLTLLASGISAVLGTGGMRAAHAQEQQGGAINDEITVTGSRIVRRDLNASSPIMTVDAQRLEQSSTISIESVLNQMPQFVPANT